MSRPPRRVRLRATAEATIRVLAEHWPRCFFLLEKRRKPIKIGIHHDILATGLVSSAELSLALRWYVGEMRYRKACVEGAPRIGLDGEPAGVVSAEHAAMQRAAVLAIIKGRSARAKAKREAEQAAYAPAPEPAPEPLVQERKPVVVERKTRRPVLSLALRRTG